MSDVRPAPTDRPRTPVSIVCVYNDAEVLATCLARSIEAGLADAPETQFLPVDNRENAFSTAGAALNHGAALATNDVIVFVHQDVYLHSLPALEAVARELVDEPGIGILGAVGIDEHKRMHGRIRDRVIGLGTPEPAPRDVESMDEVLFLVPRDQWDLEPLADDPHLGWHAYAVEYSARMRARGRRAVVRDIPLTHNSLSSNLRNLDVAHRWVGDAYPALLPLQTTCGTIEERGREGGLPKFGRRVEGLARWGRESKAATAAGGTVALRDVVLADVRFLIDDIARLSGARSIRAADLARPDAASTAVEGLLRYGLPFAAATLDVAGMRALIRDRAEGELVVVGNLDAASLAALGTPDAAHIVGHSQEAGLWLVVGADRDALAELWPGRRSRPYAGLLPSRRPGTAAAPA